MTLASKLMQIQLHDAGSDGARFPSLWPESVHPWRAGGRGLPCGDGRHRFPPSLRLTPQSPPKGYISEAKRPASGCKSWGWSFFI